MTDALKAIEETTDRLLSAEYETIEAFREAYVASGIIHDLRWLSPQMEFSEALSDMALINALDEWDDIHALYANAFLKGVEMFLEGVRIGYGEGVKKVAP